MAALPLPADMTEYARDYEALLCLLLGIHLWPQLDRADKLAVRGVSVQLREEADRCVRNLDCSSKLQSDEELERLQALCGRLVGLKSLTLRSPEAVEAVFSEDSTAVYTLPEDLAVKLSKVRPGSLSCRHGCMESVHTPWHAL
jgi:hypothetical protein